MIETSLKLSIFLSTEIYEPTRLEAQSMGGPAPTIAFAQFHKTQHQKQIEGQKRVNKQKTYGGNSKNWKYRKNEKTVI